MYVRGNIRLKVMGLLVGEHPRASECLTHFVSICPGLFWKVLYGGAVRKIGFHLLTSLMKFRTRILGSLYVIKDCKRM